MSARRVVLALALCVVDAACASPPSETPWQSLFDGRSLGEWKVADVGGSGPVEVVDGRLRLGQGSPMTCVVWTGDGASGDTPRDDYELEVAASRRLGDDFFCAVTFPVRDDALTLVLGGWGGSLCGLSCLDGEDAAHNETKSFHRFERGRLYTTRLRVSGGHVQAWLEGEPLVDVDTDGRTLSLRPEVECCRPLGIATYSTVGEVRSIALRRLPPASPSR